MRSSRKRLSASSRLSARGLGALAAATLLLTAPARPRAADGGIAVIVSPSVHADGITSAELRRVLRLDKRYWKPGEPIALLMPAMGSPTRGFVLTRFLRSTEADQRRLVLEKMYRGEIDLAPKVVATDAEAVTYAASGRGVLALVPASAITGTASVKVLRVDGRLPREAGYPLVP